jgi:IS30 family transposase
VFTGCERTRARRSRSRRNLQFTQEQWLLVLACLYQLWSPEQISGRLRRLGLLSISQEIIYRYIWNDR